MFVTHVPMGQWIAMYGPDRKLLGTVKTSTQKNGRVALVFDFPDEIRFNTKYQKPSVVCAAPAMFGDYEAPDFSIPEDADNY